ncbi:MAG TPA: hypothetical protein VL418_07600 [Devosiaceae bacterium]|nr:hypothetical protein [Devosiaceae bacterium]
MATLTETRQPAAVQDYGTWLLTLAALVAFVLTIYNYFDRSNGIHGTEGALLVVVSTALMLIAAAVIAAGWARPRWLHGLLDVLIFLDIVGTCFAGYLLESWVLVGLMVIAFIGWLVHVAAPGRPRALVVEEQ